MMATGTGEENGMELWKVESDLTAFSLNETKTHFVIAEKREVERGTPIWKLRYVYLEVVGKIILE